MADFHAKSIKQLTKELKTDLDFGLTREEVGKRQKKYGPNKLPEAKPPSAFIIFLRQFNNLFSYILMAAAIVSFLLHEYIDMWVIVAAIFLNVIIGFVQENKAQKTIFALKKMVVVTAKVLREGHVHVMDSEELVPGDIIFLDAGDKVPADARLVETMDFQVNEAALTGESVPSKKETKTLDKKVPLADRENMIYMATVAVAGKAKAVVYAIGLSTEIGHVARLLVEVKEEPTPLQIRMKKLSATIGFFVLVCCLLIIIGGVITGRSPGEMFIFGVAIAVAAIPEGLIAAVTIILALGMTRILRKKALTRTLLAAETLGSTSVICADKTGTITSGKMVVERIHTTSGSCSVRDLGKRDGELNQVLKIGMLCNDLHFESIEGPPEKWRLIGDPTEKALIIAAGLANLDKAELEKDLVQVTEIPFDSYLKYMATAYQDKKAKKIRIFVKGATERLLSESGYLYKKGRVHKFTEREKEKFLKINEELSKKAYRVIACAFKEIKVSKEKLDLKKEVESNLVFCGVIGIRDPIRPGVKEAIKMCLGAGIKIKMITGDHKLTAQAIAKEIGLPAQDEEILSGDEMDSMTPDQLEYKIPKIKIFARVAPKHKIQIVDALQRQKEVTAMTGDGVNDAPALKSADIGIAMGTGTEVAKEASDMILEDNNFRTIEAAVEEGRNIFNNIRKVTLYLLSDSFSELILIGGCLLLGLPLPILPVQILWVNLVEDGLPDFALAFEPGEKEVMKDPPRKLEEPILNQEMKVLIFIIGIITDLILFGLFLWLWKTTHDLVYIRTMIFAALGVDSLLYVFSCRSLRHSIFQKNPLTNKLLVLAVVIGFTMIFLALYTPFFQTILRTQALSLKDWSILIGLGIFEIIAIEITKWIFIVKKKKAYA